MSDPLPTSLPDAPRAGGETPINGPEMVKRLTLIADMIDDMATDDLIPAERAETELDAAEVRKLACVLPLLLRDGDLLDFLDDQAHLYQSPLCEHFLDKYELWLNAHSSNPETFYGETLREAIGAAMDSMSAPSAERA